MSEKTYPMDNRAFRIASDKSVISIVGAPSYSHTRNITAAVHDLVKRKGYRHLGLDFSRLAFIQTSSILPLITLVQNLQASGLRTEISLPRDPTLRHLFLNANWAHLLDPEHHDESNYRGRSVVPAIPFNNPGSQDAAVKKIMSVVLGSAPRIDRNHIQALEWCLTEITDNVLNHAEIKTGGLVQATTYPRTNTVEFVVADAGIGIPVSLREKDHKLALERAVQEGVTKNKKTNAGNGLFGTLQVAIKSQGTFQLDSLTATLYTTSDEKLRIATPTLTRDDKPIPLPGTVVRCRISCTTDFSLADALRFKGTSHIPPFDFIEQNYEVADGEGFRVKLRQESHSLGSRDAGKTVYNKVANLLRMKSDNVVTIDFDGINIVSSSFADEVFGRLFVDMGPLMFAGRLKFENVDSTVSTLIDRSIRQRAASGN